MQVILTQSVDTLGTAGDLVTVKPGYARNFLLPKKLAVVASTNNVKEFEHQKRTAAYAAAQAKTSAEGFAAALGNLTLTFARKVGDQDKLFGSVTSHDIERALAEQGHELSRRVIELAEPIKALGSAEVKVHVHKDVSVQLKIEVVAE